jgi:circadian clock protein KaiB
MYKFILFIAGFNSPTSQRAVNDVKNFLDKYMTELYSFSIIDIVDDTKCARSRKIFATPVFIKTSPGPERRVFGTFSDSEKVLENLGIDLTNKK